MESSIRIEDNYDRNSLSEGRDYGMGFAFCKKIDSTNYETIQAISACKDYLNDVVFVEDTGIEFEAYGLYTKKNDIFKDKKAYLAISIIPRQGDTTYTAGTRTYLKDTALLKKNYKLVEQFVNHIEPTTKTLIRRANDNRFLVSFDKEWIKTTFGISLLSFLIRVGLFWDGKQNPVDYLKEVSQTTSNDEYGIAIKVVPVVERIIKDKSLKCFEGKQDFRGEVYKKWPSTVHDHGICTLTL